MTQYNKLSRTEMQTLQRQVEEMRADYLGSIVRRIGDALRSLFAKSRRARLEEFDLYSMNDRELADIGLRRSDIRLLAKGQLPLPRHDQAETPAPRRPANTDVKRQRHAA